MSQTSSSAQDTVVMSSVLCVVAVLLGLICAAAPLAAALLMGAVVVALVVMTVPLNWITTLELVLATVVAGAVEYFAGLQQANWIPYLLALLLGLRALTQWKTPLEKHAVANFRPARPWFILPMAVYFLTLIASVGINLPPLTQLVVALKNYLFMWGVLLAFLAVRRFDAAAAVTWRAVVLVSCVQLPVVLYQKFFIASRLSNAGGAAGVSWDAISGTFGGGLLGGHSAAMALFITMAIAVSLVAWRNRTISLPRAGLICVLVLPALFFAEVKAVIVWLALTGFLIFFRQIRTRPLVFLAGMLAFMLVVGGIAIAYKTMYYEGSHAVDFTGLYEKQVKYFFDPDRFNQITREMGRVASVAFWWRQHDISDPVRMMLGHGPGASRGISSFAVGEVAQRFNFFIDTSAATALLWDVGLLGFGSFAGMLFLGALEGYFLARRKNLPADLRTSVECASIGLLLILSGLIYNRDSIDAASIQFLMFFFFAVLMRAKGFTSRSPVA